MSHHRRETDSPDISLLSCSRLVTPSCISYYLLLSIGTNSDGLQSVSLWSLIWRFSQSREEWEMDSILFYLTRTLASEDQTPNIWEAISPQILTRRATTTITLSQAYKDEAMLRPVTRDLWDCQVSLLRVKDQIHSTTFNVIFLKYVCIYHKHKSVSYKLTWFDLTIIYWFITSVDHSDNYDSAARKCWYLPWLASYISAKRRSIMSWCLKH